jgi:hypothetical protein
MAASAGGSAGGTLGVEGKDIQALAAYGFSMHALKGSRTAQ